MMSGITESNASSQWSQAVQSSPEAREARHALEMQRRKIRQIHEELHSAEILEEELKQRLKTAEIRLKPAIMSFAEKLEHCQRLEEDFVEKTFSQVEETDDIISVMREKEKNLHQMNRSQLLSFVKTVIYVRDCLLEKNLTDGVDATQVGLHTDQRLLQIDFQFRKWP